MIKYSLRCCNGHSFEAWFGSSSAYDRQERDNLVECPDCGVGSVERQPMAPAVHSGRRYKRAGTKAPEKRVEAAAPVIDALRALKQHILANSEDVGARFAAEARAMHDGDTEPRSIRGAATALEAEALTADGIAFSMLPVLPEDLN